MADTPTFATPDHAAQALAAGTVQAGPASSEQRVCLGLTGNGWFNLIWNASATGSYDWIGLFASPQTPDSGYVGGNNWQWAVKGNSYATYTAAQANYEARYMVWDSRQGKYVSVVRSGAFPGQVCSS